MAFILAAFSLLLPEAPPATAGDVPIAGIYFVSGMDPRGSPYSGVVLLEPDGVGFTVSYAFRNEGGFSKGSARRDGKVLNVAFGAGPRPGIAAMVITVEKGTPKLAGKWYAGGGAEGKEEWTLLRAG